jgi:hypothetical protein
MFIEGDHIPEEYRGWYTLADFSGWLRAIQFNEFNEPVKVETWSEDIGAAVHITQSPYDGCIYVTTLGPSRIKRICFGGNLRPVISVNPDLVYGIGTQEVTFDASETYDPENDPMTFDWIFSDGSSGTGEFISKNFEPSGSATELQWALLTVSDTAGNQSSLEIPVSLNNTPPQANIVSIQEGELYSVLSPTVFNLVAEIEDAEHSAEEFTYDWTHILHHNTHFHLLDQYQGNNQNVVVYPTGCSPFETYWYELQVTVTDPGGLKASDSRMIYPDCDQTLEEDEDLENPFTLSPNPATDQINIVSRISLPSVVNTKIYTIEGALKRELEIPVYNNRRYFSIDVRDLSESVYILQIEVSGKRYRYRFVKTR